MSLVETRWSTVLGKVARVNLRRSETFTIGASNTSRRSYSSTEILAKLRASIFSNCRLTMDTTIAVILLSPVHGDHTHLLERKIAGISIFKRLILTLQRAGLAEFMVLSEQLSKGEIDGYRKDIESDTRFVSRLHWVDRDAFASEESGKTQDLTLSRPCLVVNGNLVTHQTVVRRFLEAVGTGDSGTSKCLSLKTIQPGGLYLIPPSTLRALREGAIGYHDVDGLQPVELSEDNYFWVEVRDPDSASAAEKHLLRYNRRQYTQHMDIWFNSRLSTPISAALVKTSVTPNVLTLGGLLIGFAAGWCFADGSYLGSLIGGLLLVLTAVGDCCDGDVARLKLMETDFGDTLDTTCDNIINVFVFTGMMLGVSKTNGWEYALPPVIMLAVGGCLIFAFIYFPRDGKGSFFAGSKMFDVIQVLASRNFIYVVFVFAIAGRLDWFLWLAGVGAPIFAACLYIAKRCIAA